jgi:hypothetical protein
MAKEEGIFVVAEDEMIREEEIISVAEEEVFRPTPKPEPEAPKSWLESKETKHFPKFLQDEFNRIKKPELARSSISEMERALAQWKELNGHISKALRDDYHSALDAKWLDKMRSVVEQNIDQLEMALDSYKQLQQNRKNLRRRGEEDREEELVKEATTPTYHGFQTNVTAFETGVVRALINGVVSGGRNIEELYEIAKKKYDLTPREELAIFQILSDMGYPTFHDRLRLGEEDGDPSDPDKIGEWQSQYYS